MTIFSEWLTIIRDVGKTIYEAFVLPGDFVLSLLAAKAPGLAASLGIRDDGSIMLLLGLSLLTWFLLAVVVRKIFGLWQNLARIVSATMRTISFRASLRLRNYKTRLMCRLRHLIPQRSGGAIADPEVEFDDLDLAVLRSAAARGPGFATSAPELAEQLAMRPAVIQRSLEKLNKNKMLDNIIGTTDGFDNYRLSQSGVAFMSMWQRNRSRVSATQDAVQISPPGR